MSFNTQLLTDEEPLTTVGNTVLVATAVDVSANKMIDMVWLLVYCLYLLLKEEIVDVIVRLDN